MNTNISQEIQTLKLRMQRQQRLVLVGQLAAATAHEVNNALMAIMADAQMLAKVLSIDNPTRKAAEMILTESNRISVLMRNSLCLVREQASYKPADISNIVNAALDATGPMLRCQQVRVAVQVPKGLPLVVCQSHEIQQVLINLLLNACHALSMRYPNYDAHKTICITAYVFEKDARKNLRITVEDNGVGITPEALPNIFRPGFTTKDECDGSGLGLPICREIAEAHQGILWAESDPGIKTSFHLDLPAYDAEGNNNDNAPT
jgi:signal transduction histidine kinase